MEPFRPTRTNERPRSRDGSGAVRNMMERPSFRVPCRACEAWGEGRSFFFQAWPTSKRANRSTVIPASSTICFTVRLGSVIEGCSSSTKSL
jgi:hypothetical protein